ncbi:hypothetical protein [Labilibaculum manganireducens]|uniref:hypothetical protein n=1 Tax=Labilibaculum manganireducens TaxID=1940525 RepID=UPI0029F51FEF|nr:hypothetical protein [Labilibaculum manganireducens]
MEDTINELKAYKLETFPVEEIKASIFKFGKVPVAVTDYDAGKIIHRARPIKKGINLTEDHELSFTPEEYNTKYQRASTPEQTMFYGAVVPEIEGEGEITSERIIGASEVSDFLRNPESEDGEEIIVFGKWLVKEKITLLSIINPEVQNNKIKFFQDMTKDYHTFLNSIGEKKKDAIAFQEYMSSEFSKSEILGEHDYLITAKFTENLIEKCDGVIYPSVRADYNGLCVAIKPESAKTKLELIEVLECSLIKKDKSIKLTNLRHTDKVEDGKFKLIELKE